MGTITSGTGLVSGINTTDLIAKLMSIEKQPLTALQTRIQTQTQIKTAYTALTAQFLLAKTAAGTLGKIDTFDARTASSSNENVLSASATSATPINTYTFQVAGLVTTHQLVSAGFESRSTQLGAGTLTLESGQGSSVNATTQLSDLNGQQGVKRGNIRITDRSGASTNIDLRFATTVQDVLDAINNQASVQVKASVQGDRLVLNDQTGLSSGNLLVTNVGGGTTATDLGLVGTGTSQITGADLVRLVDATPLTRLNDGNGVRVNGISDDIRFTLHDGRQINVNLSGVLRFSTKLAELNDGRGIRSGTIRITNRAGTTKDVDLSGATTIQQVVDAINSSGALVTASLSSSKITLSDSSSGTSNFKIEDLSGHAATDLGIAVDVAANSAVGSSIYRINSLGSALRAIQNATGNDGALTAAIAADGDHLVFTDTTAGGGTTTVEQLNNSQAAKDLGLLGDFSSGTLTTGRLLSGLNTVLLSNLNGGNGVDTSALTITRQTGGGTSAESISLSGASSLQDIIDAINSHVDGSSQNVFHAEISEGGTGLVIRDIAGGEITTVAGASATDLHLEVSQQGTVESGDLQRRYISENTALASLNAGKGVAQSSFRISGTDGRVATVSLSSADKTLGDVIDSINATAIGITARINDQGDGILLSDSNGGAGKIVVTENGSTTAADLGILKTTTGNTLNGSFAKSLQVNGNDTLDTLVTKINAANLGVKASVVNDGSATAPYRLVLTSTTGGAAGQINFNSGTTGLSFSTLTQGQDAKLVVGDPNSANSVVVTSSSNTVKNVVDGLTLQLKDTSANPVQITVKSDVDSVVTNLNSFISTVNSGFDKISDLTSYNADTQQAGLLLGDSTVLQVRDRVVSALSASLKGQGLAFSTLAQIGITFGGGAHLQLDEAKFRQAVSDSPEDVKKLFTLTTTGSDGKLKNLGFGSAMAQVIDDLTKSGTGLLIQQASQVQNKIDLYNTRVTDLQKLLDAKQARLTAQFNAMETALATLQSQQSALASLSSIAGLTSSASSSSTSTA